MLRTDKVIAMKPCAVFFGPPCMLDTWLLA